MYDVKLVHETSMRVKELKQKNICIGVWLFVNLIHQGSVVGIVSLSLNENGAEVIATLVFNFVDFLSSMCISCNSESGFPTHQWFSTTS